MTIPRSADQAANAGTAGPTDPTRAARSVYAVFIAGGFVFASWASRIPQFKARLDVDPGRLGLILLAAALGSVVALPLAGMVVTRLGDARAVAVMSLVLAVGLAVAAVGYQHGAVPVTAGLFVLGFGNGGWDVAMNVQGAAVEQRLGRAIMPRFHAGFSVGTVAGALVGSLMVALRVSPTEHLLVIAALTALIVPAAARGFAPAASRPGPATAGGRRHPLKSWTEPRTLLIGIFVLCMAFAEGTGTDWLAVAVIDGYDAPAAVGTLVLAAFLAAMTAGRWVGPVVLDRHGRVPALRICILVAVIGLMLVVFSPSVATVLVGSVLWGLGASLGFPVGMSAAGEDPAHAAARVSVVASIGYTAFLAGPPLIGFLGDHFGVLHSLVVAAALLVVALATVGATRRPQPVAGYGR